MDDDARGCGLPVISECRKEVHQPEAAPSSPEEGSQDGRMPTWAAEYSAGAEPVSKVGPAPSSEYCFLGRTHSLGPPSATKNHKMGSLEPWKFIVSQFWRPKSSCGQATLPLKVLAKDPFQTSLLASGSLRHSLACRRLSSLYFSLHRVFPLYLSVSGSKFPLSIRTSVILDGGPPLF